MTQPRMIIPGATYMVTRRTVRRHYLFRPDAAIRRLYLYSLAVCAKQFNVEVSVIGLMSSHEHLIVTDPDGHLPSFLRQFHRLVALGTKVLRKWEGAVWDHEKTSVVRLLTERAVLEKIAYVMANPVKAGLVRYAKDWPGIHVRPQDLGRQVLRVQRPDVYFDADNPQWPDEVELRLTLPATLRKRYAVQAIRDTVAAELRLQEQDARRAISAKGWSVMGAERIKKCSPYRRAKSFEPLIGRNPTFAVGRKQKTAFFKAVEALRSFRRAYHDAFAKWRSGLRNVEFPLGTWLMSRIHGVPAILDS